ncbi:MAG: hypothetical protein IPJ69_09385 [Deltaproteobacteria bacterium]|nr:MAG: hypothetical protein IPJ69_09385 [Deltaproteobacteria bacterium]
MSLDPAHKADWTSLSDEELLNKKVCDLHLSIPGSELEEPIQQLYHELNSHQILFRPECYLSDEWFVIEGDTTIGIPFYLAHPQLKKLEEKMMLEVEGGTRDWCLKLLRHETGHAIFYAYHLNKKRDVRKLFGPSPKEIPETYRPKPYSRSYVRHLDNWYAQAEPDEDFAETFAVWLTPDSNWKTQYKGWPAFQKLLLIDTLMKEIADKTPPNLSRTKTGPVSQMRLTLKTYYSRKQKYYAQDYPDFYDQDLKKIFGGNESKNAFSFMKRYRKTMSDHIARWTGEKKFIVNNLFKKLTDRCEKLQLSLNKPEEETLLEVTTYLSSMISNYIYTGKFKPTV